MMIGNSDIEGYNIVSCQLTPFDIETMQLLYEGQKIYTLLIAVFVAHV